MGFIVYFPYNKNAPITLNTTNQLIPQLWQELVMLRHLKGQKHISAPKAISPWIDQGKTYFLDASKSDWRSAGLLYYYSFLNLAKALLVAKKHFSYKVLNTTSIYHGLQADLQTISFLIDYKFKIFPQQQNGRNNIFAHLYKIITGVNWPFNDVLEIKVGDIAGYCQDVSAEYQKLFKIEHKIFPSQSLIRSVNNQFWFEMTAPAPNADTIISSLPNWNLEKASNEQISETDKNDWLLSFHKTGGFFSNTRLLRAPKQTYNTENQDQIIRQVAEEAKNNLKPFLVLPTYEEIYSPFWLFAPEIELSNVKLKWHPLLSDYLMAFVLSSILRYQPQVLQSSTSNFFVAEAWCAQSAKSALQYFLMQFTNPPLRIKSI
jgi:YaaC-like Protein